MMSSVPSMAPDPGMSPPGPFHWNTRTVEVSPPLVKSLRTRTSPSLWVPENFPASGPVVIGPTAVSRSSSVGNDGKGLNGFTRYYDGAAKAPWLYNPALNGGTFISYVDPHAVADRARLVRQDKLRGLWAWEISNDDNAGDLTAALAP